MDKRKTVDIPKAWLVAHYRDQELSLMEIAQLKGCTDQSVARYLDKYKIGRRSVKEQRAICAKRRRFRRLTTAGFTAEKLSLRYVEEGASIKMLEAETGIGRETIRKLMDDLDIGKRTKEEGYRLAVAQHRTGPEGAERLMDQRGYWLVKMSDHPRANNKGFVFEHVLVWEEHHGRALREDQVVHHINGVRSDNKPENLRAMTRADHQRFHRYAQRKAGDAVHKCPEMFLPAFLGAWDAERTENAQLTIPDLIPEVEEVAV